MDRQQKEKPCAVKVNLSFRFPVAEQALAVDTFKL